MIRIGLTGNIACGKSTIARRLAELGAVVLDADAVVHELLAEGGAAVPAIREAFPALPPGPGIDRRALGAIVFADAQERRRLEAILHPLVRQRQMEAEAQAREAGARAFVVEASQLLESWRGGGPDPRDRFDALVVVTCDPEVQLARLLERGGATMRREDALARIAAQMPQAEKAALADEVIDNSGTPQAARDAADLLFSKLVPEA